MTELIVLICWVSVCYVAIDWINHCNDPDWLYKCDEEEYMTILEAIEHLEAYKDKLQMTCPYKWDPAMEMALQALKEKAEICDIK